FLRSIDLNPKNYLVFNDLGTLYRFLGKTEKAIRALHMSLAIYPNQQNVKKILGELENFKNR
ncbi:MAG: tetratricopeptide repeat protein, partial [Deltaproteobacteria bacterium]|nr:tetratricopeptide repeat protein [Deltaproteobacteria bacterium]